MHKQYHWLIIQKNAQVSTTHAVSVSCTHHVDIVTTPPTASHVQPSQWVSNLRMRQ